MKRKMKKTSAAAIAFVMSLLLLPACSGTQTETPAPAPEPAQTEAAESSVTEPAPPTAESQPAVEKTVIRVLRAGTEEHVRAWAEPAAEEFNKNNPDIEIQFEYDSFGGWINRYTTLFETNTQPDIVFWWDNQLREKGVAEKLVAFDGIVDPEVLAKYPQGLKDIGTVDGKLVYLPQAVDPVMVYYNKEIFAQAGLDPENFPKTWDEFAAACKAIYENTGIPALGFQGGLGINTLQEFVALYYHQATGKDWLDENNQPIFNTPEAVQALEYLKELQQYCQPGFENQARGDLRAPFRDGQVAMTLDGSWINKMLIEKYGEDLDNSIIGMATVPDGPVPKTTWLSTNGWIITTPDPAKQEAAGKVLSFLISEEQVYKHHAAYGANPILDYELDYPPFTYDYWALAPEIIENNTLFTMIGRNHPTPKAFYVQFEEIWQQFLLDEIGAQEALDLAEEAAHEINARAGIE